METLSDQQAGTGRTILVVKRGTKDRLEKLMQELGIQGTADDNRLSLLIDKYYQLVKPTTEESQP